MAMAQTKYKNRKAEISFFSSTPLEDINAISNNVKYIVDFENNKVAFLVPIRSFDFPQKRMQEHFNDTYLESGIYPNATFKGLFQDKIDFSKPRQYVRIKGVFNIHGKEKTIELKALVLQLDGRLKFEAKFMIVPSDFGIEIPQILALKIAESIEIKVKFEMIDTKTDQVELGV